MKDFFEGQKEKLKDFFSKLREKSGGLSEKFDEKFDELKKKYTVIALVILLLILIGSGVYVGTELPKDRIHPGVSVGGVRLSGLNVEAAEKRLDEELSPRLKEEKVRLKTDVTSYFPTWKELGFYYDTEELAKAAYGVGRSSSGFDRGWRVLKAGIFGERLDAEVSVDQLILSRKVRDLANLIYVEPVNAEFFYEDGEINVTKDRPGTYLDMNEAQELLAKQDATAEELKLPVYKTDPEQTKEDFAKINGILGTFETNYKSSEKSRKHNIKKGAAAMSNKLVRPGEEVSFNDTVGEISKDAGYEDAGVIVNGQFDRGVGGGMCQVSTTLYNALLLADVDITERSNHTRPIGYVPKGTDAAVASGYKDLKFKNNFDFPIYITSEADGSTLTFTIFGDTTNRDYTIEIEPVLQGTAAPKTVKRTSSKLAPGDQKVEQGGSTGYYYKTYKKVIKDGEVVSKEEISESNYPAQTRVVYVGPPKSSKSEDSSGSRSSKKSDSSSSSNSSSNND